MGSRAVLIELLVILAVVALGIGFLVGCLDESLGGGCKHRNIASYSPGYHLGCSFFKNRWVDDSDFTIIDGDEPQDDDE